VLLFQATAFRTDFTDPNTWCIINKYSSIGQGTHRHRKLAPVLCNQLSIPEPLGIDITFCTKHPLNELLCAHLQAEYRNIFICVNGHVLRYIQGKGSFTNRWSCCNND